MYNFSSPVPFVPLIHGTTNKEVRMTPMVNWVNRDVFEKREVTIGYFLHGSISVCHSCKSEILEGDIGGRDFYRDSDHYCFDCIEVPGGIENVLAVMIHYKRKKKSRRFPDGIAIFADVFINQASLDQYKLEMQEAGYPVLSATILNR